MIAVADTPAMPPDDDQDDAPGVKRRSIDPMLKRIDRCFAAFEELPPGVRGIALTLVNERFAEIDDSVLDPRD